MASHAASSRAVRPYKTTVLLLLAVSPAAVTAGAQQALTSVRAVRNLSAEQAAGSPPIHLRGTVMAMPGYRNSFFVQDSTGGISVNRADSADVHAGDAVEIDGVAEAGKFAPVIQASTVRVTGRGRAVPPVIVTSYAELEGGRLDSQWVEVTGIVHAVGMRHLWGHDLPRLLLYLQGDLVRVLLPEGTAIDASRLIDATVTVRGTCATIFNDRRQFLGVRVFVPDVSNIRILKAPIDPFALPATSLRSVLQFAPTNETAHRVKVSGTVSYSNPGHSLFLQEGNDSIEVQTTFAQPLLPGSRVEVAGFPTIDDYAPVLKDGVVRGLPGHGTVPVRPIDASAVIAERDGFAQVEQDQRLIQVTGEVIGEHIRGAERIWTLRAKNTVFDARLLLKEPVDGLEKMGVGSTLQLTGVCLVHSDTNHDPKSFTLLMRGAGDIRVLHRSAWWTLRKAGLLGAFFGVVALLIAVWGMILRRQVSRQTRLIRESEQRFRELAEFDPLTGVRNRLSLETCLQRVLRVCDREHATAAIIAVDVDHFKRVNDTHGHHVGDECLKAVASRLKDATAGMGLIFRMGGEEFLIATKASRGEADRLCTALMKMFTTPLLLGDLHLPVTVSIGVAMYPDGAADTVLLQALADEALYEAKRTGRNRVVFARDTQAAEVLAEESDEPAFC